MARSRVIETDQGIQGECNVRIYDQLQRSLRDRGFLGTGDIIKTGITGGLALELGPGPGYLGLEWLKNTQGTALKGLDISADMIAAAERNAAEYGFSERVDYTNGSGERIPFDDGTFDAVFTNGSLHEWSEPVATFGEIWRVLKSGGRVYISDLRRDMFFVLKWFMWIMTKPAEIRPGFLTSVDAAYTPGELRQLIRGTRLETCVVSGSPIGLTLMGVK